MLVNPKLVHLLKSTINNFSKRGGKLWQLRCSTNILPRHTNAPIPRGCSSSHLPRFTHHTWQQDLLLVHQVHTTSPHLAQKGSSHWTISSWKEKTESSNGNAYLLAMCYHVEGLFDNSRLLKPEDSLNLVTDDSGASILITLHNNNFNFWHTCSPSHNLKRNWWWLWSRWNWNSHLCKYSTTPVPAQTSFRSFRQ